MRRKRETMKASKVLDRIDRTLACISEFVSLRHRANHVSAAVALALCCGAPSAVAQTVTGSGSSGEIPVFTGASTLGNSPFAVSGGNVGIGTTLPAYPLDIAASAGGEGSPTMRLTSLNSWSGIVFNSYAEEAGGQQPVGGIFGEAAAGWNSSIHFVLNSNWGAPTVEPLTLKNGNVGIGTTSPMVQGGGNGLEISGNGANKLLRLSDSSNNSYTLGFATSAASGYSVIQGEHAGVAYTPLLLNPYGSKVGIGTTSPSATLEVNGSVKLTSGSGASLTFADGTVQSTAYTGTCTATGGDYAESMEVTGERSGYEPGDVMVLAKDSKFDVTKSSEPYSTMVAGIYSTKPGYVGRRQQADPKLSNTEIPMAMVGVVPTKVSAENGPIHRGDLLVTASKSGYAMRGTNHRRMMGAVVGKAMGSLDSGTGVIDVLVSLQ